MKKEFYQRSDFVAYTADNKALTREQYQKRVNAGNEQCMRGESYVSEIESITCGTKLKLSEL